MSKPIDWADIWVHLIVAFFSVVLFGLGDLFIAGMAGQVWLGFGLNAFGWPLREAIQRRLKDRHDWCRPWLWSRQKHLEAWLPIIAALIPALLVLMVRAAG